MIPAVRTSEDLNIAHLFACSLTKRIRAVNKQIEKVSPQTAQGKTVQEFVGSSLRYAEDLTLRFKLFRSLCADDNERNIWLFVEVNTNINSLIDVTRKTLALVNKSIDYEKIWKGVTR